MKRALLSLILVVGGSISAFAQFFSAGNLAVTHVGDGTTALNGFGNNVAIDEYNTAGALQQSFPLAQTGPTPFSMTGNATAEGALSLSEDGRSLTFAGYQSARLSSGSLAGSTAAAVPRTIAEISVFGVITKPVVSSTAFSANSLRSAVTDGANNYWALGVGTGVTYMGNNASAATIETAQTTLRVMNIVNGDLYFSAAGSIFKVTGKPQSGTATPVAVINNVGASPSTYDFAFNAGLTLAYVADDRTTANGGGIQRWSWNGSTWNLDYTLAAGGGLGARGLAVDFSGANPVVYATTTEAANNRLIKIVDTGAGSAETDLALSGTVRAFRGLEFTPIPEPSTFVFAGIGAAAMLILRRRK